MILGDAITSIGSSAFFGCTALREVRGARSLTKIGNYAFYGCTSLTTVPIPEGIRSLGDFCFNGCAGLNVTALPSSLTHIGNRIFGENFGATLTVYDNATYIASGDNPYYYLYSAVNQEITSVSLHPDTRVIMGSAFKTCTALYLVDLGNTVERICDEAFWRCSALESIVLPQSTVALGNNAFRSCSSLSSILLSDNLLALGLDSFRDCERLVTYAYGGAKYLSSQNNPYYALLSADSKSISSIDIHPSTKIIGADAFVDCENLRST